MPKPNVLVIAPRDHYLLRGLEPIKNIANVNIGTDRASLEAHAPEADIILFTGVAKTDIPFPDIWRLTKHVRWLHSLSAGMDKILFPDLIESSVPVTNARGVFRRSLADWTILGILYFYKRVPRLIENKRAHRWEEVLTDWIADRVMGIVGYGEIGRECARLAKALGIKIYATRRRPELSKDDPLLDRIFPSTQLKEMLEQCDIVLASAPLTPETYHMLSHDQFNSMKPTAIVINVGRGPVIEDAALIEALQSKRIAGAALDVFEHEPLPPDHPLWDMDNVLISPHSTDHSRDPDWLDLSVQCFVENFHRFLKGEPLNNLVDKKAGY
jgi:phosphoglycerate dehydrogenase-like enzyme